MYAELADFLVEHDAQTEGYEGVVERLEQGAVEGNPTLVAV